MISKGMDQRIRKEMRSLFLKADELLDLRAVNPDRPGSWLVDEKFPAAADEGITTELPAYFIVEHFSGLSDNDSGLTNLPLVCVHDLLESAAGGMAALGELTTSKSVKARSAGIGALSRSVAEHSATAFWILAGSSRDDRLRRTLLWEIAGIRELMRYLPAARLNKDGQDLESARTRFLQIAAENFSSVQSQPLKIDGTALPNLTDRVKAVVSAEQYVELNVFTHPTGHRRPVLANWSAAGGSGQAVFPDGDSTLHDESRLSLIAALAFGRALLSTCTYIGAPAIPAVEEWVSSCAETSTAWCEANGCLSDQASE